MSENNVWEVVDQPNTNIINSKWVFDVKRNENGRIVKLKARLVAMGNTQEKGFDFFETFAPTINKTTLRLFIIYCLVNNLEIFQLDVETAFLQANLDQELHMKLPLGTDYYAPGKCLKLKRARGLKQSNRLFSLKFREVMQNNGWKSILSDRCLYRRGEQISLHHVDDVLF